MIAVFLKELRENLIWAGVICATMLVFVWHDMRSASPFFLMGLSEHFLLAVAPIAGLLMGVVQTIFETRPDNWAFVVHRPVPRLQIFIAKSAAGLLLLYTALIVPLLLAALWASRPSHLAMPFQARMMLVTLADALNAACYYFAAMNIVLRRSRWFGSRLLPLLFPLASSAILFLFIPEFWQAAVCVALFATIGAVAAWGAFAGNGILDEALAPRFALGTMIFPGAIGIAMFLVAMAGQFTSTGGRWQYHRIDRDGNVVRITQTLENDEKGFAWTYTDIDGKPIAKYENVDMNDPANNELFLRFSGFLADERGLSWPISVMYTGQSYRAATPGIVGLRSVAPQGVRLRSAALYDNLDRIIKLYDPAMRTMIGTVGPAGFAPAHEAPAQRFPGTPRNLSARGNLRTLPFDSIVYWIELDQRRVRPIFTPPAGETVYSATEAGPQTDPTVLVATRQTLYVLKPTGEMIFSTPMMFDPYRYALEPAIVPSNHHLIIDASTYPGIDPRDNRILEFDTAGKLLRTTVPPKLPEFRGPKLQETAMFGMTFPLAARPLIPGWILDNVVDLRSEAFPKVFEGCMIGSAIVCAIVTFLLSLRMRFSKAKTLNWTIANLLLGPAGVVVMLSLNDWPAREICAACGGTRIIGRRECTECGVSLPAPEADGREIFEPVDAFQPAMG